MRKTSAYLTDELAARLRRIAEAEGRSQAEVLRAAIEAYPEPTPRRHIHAYAVAEGPGDDVWTLPEEELLEGFGEE